MKKFYLIFFIAFSTIAFNSVHGKSNFSFVRNFADTLKMQNTTAKDSSKKIIDDTTKISKKKFLIPLKQKTFVDTLNEGNILKKNEIDKSDYRYTGNFFSNIPFGFLKDLGSVGLPSEILIYGQGSGSSSFLSDGIEINNRLTNSFDANLFQSERINEVEVVPLVQGFLYSTKNNPVSVNFVSNDFKENIPYTRIRFFQAPYQEGFFDGTFNSTFGKRLGVYAEFTNQSTDPRFTNSDHSAWLASTRFRYLFSDKFNLTASYSYANTKTQLNGGIDYDSIKRSTNQNQIDNILYDNLQAPVNYINRYQKITSHNFSINALAEFIPNSPTSITFYYQTGLKEFRQNDSTNKLNLQNGIASIHNNDRYKTSGINFDQTFKYDFMKLDAIAGFEQNTLDSPLLTNELKRNSIWLTAKAGFELLDKKISASFFAKYLNYNSNFYNGLGADLIYAIDRYFSIYAGYSEFQKPWDDFYTISSTEKSKIRSAEFYIAYKNENINLRAGFFNINHFAKNIPVFITNISEKGMEQYAAFYKLDDVTQRGINFKIDIRLWKFLLSTNSNFYFSDDGLKSAGIPEFNSNGGVYYIDTLFNSNLKLKTGLNYYSVGSRGNSFIDYEKNIPANYTLFIAPNIRSAVTPAAGSYSPSYQIDFFLAGQIQDNATVYFTFENILGTKYFIVPYYPMYERGMRFGVAWEFFN